MRKLATIRRIDSIVPIEGADSIVLVIVGGWQCVALKTEFQPGDLCIYFEIDSWIPRMPQIEHLYERAKKIFNGREGIKIKTIKLKGQISQGLALPIFNFPQVAANIPITGWNPDAFTPEEYQELIKQDDERLIGLDVSEYLGVEKWELPIPSDLSGIVKDNFPTFIQKTDQERCQNMGREIFTHNVDSQYEVTMKLDGTSFTAFYRDGEDGVCGRNWQLDINEFTEDNKIVRMYIDSNLQAVLRELGMNYAVQGELLGPGIQKNREGLKAYKLFIFDIYDINNMRYLTPYQRGQVMETLYDYGLDSEYATHVPVIANNVTLVDIGIHNMKELLTYAEGPSLVHPTREGLVFKRMDGEFSFKAISNRFLLKEED